jgi:hypothetical protein
MAEERGRGARWVDRGWYLVVEFSQTRSERYDEAVELARALPDYVEILDENRRGIHRSVVRRAELGERVWTLLEIIEPWKSARGYVCGDELAIGDIRAGLRCFVWEKEHLGCDPDPEMVPTYFGCPRSHVGLWLDARQPWYHEAHPRSGREVFAVPKERLLKRLRSFLKAWRICPNLDYAATEEFLQRLPEEIDLAADRRWRISSWWSGRRLEPSSPGDYYDFLLEHLYGEPRRNNGED